MDNRHSYPMWERGWLPALASLDGTAASVVLHNVSNRRLAPNTSTRNCRSVLSESGSLNIGVLGGSISWGAELEHDGSSWGARARVEDSPGRKNHSDNALYNSLVFIYIKICSVSSE